MATASSHCVPHLHYRRSSIHSCLSPLAAGGVIVGATTAGGRQVLDVDSKNVKALYRRAQAYIQLVDLDLAEQDIKRALEIDPDNRDVKLESKILKEKVREYDKKDAQFYGSIFAKMNKLEQARSANTPQKQEPVPMIIDSKV